MAKTIVVGLIYKERENIPSLEFIHGVCMEKGVNI